MTKDIGHRFIFSLLIISLVYVHSSALAYRQSSESLRCKTKLISIGDSKYEVLEQCGEPTWVQTREEERIRRDYYNPYLFDEDPYYNQYRTPLLVKEKVIIEEWTYNFGSSRFIRYLTFENGRLVSIETGGYGY